MSNSTQSFKELFLSVYLPALLAFFAIVAGATCLSVGPFIPVGFSGLVTIVAGVYAAITLIRNKNKMSEMKDTIVFMEDKSNSVQKRLNSDIARRDETIEELNCKIALLNTELKVAKTPKEEKTVEEPQKPEELKKVTKTTKKKA